MIRYRQWLLRIPGVKRVDGFHKALAVKVELVLAHTVDSQKLRIGNRLDTAMSRNVLSEKTMYGGLPISWAMVRRSSRSFWNSASSSSSGI